MTPVRIALADSMLPQSAKAKRGSHAPTKLHTPVHGFMSALLPAQTPTRSKEESRLLSQQCASCQQIKGSTVSWSWLSFIAVLSPLPSSGLSPYQASPASYPSCPSSSSPPSSPSSPSSHYYPSSPSPSSPSSPSSYSSPSSPSSPAYSVAYSPSSPSSPFSPLYPSSPSSCSSPSSPSCHGQPPYRYPSSSSSSSSPSCHYSSCPSPSSLSFSVLPRP
eukprot:UN0634